ncbi:unnamed protein product [Moneuplotes crassus]|uniref:Chromatin modification-related protein MEAF6 n=1 Tax=Euplotes crassus TaxID=5936 RepID=A0AAD1Y1H8_EUPCR|nr:unnamed protein product [Moneuplotes crassus]
MASDGISKGKKMSISALKAKVDQELKNLEDHIYERETEYLTNTVNTGNIARGWEYLLDSKRVITKDMVSNFKISDFAKDYESKNMYSAMKGCKPVDLNSKRVGLGKFPVEDRVFSRSSKTAPIEDDYIEYPFQAPPIKLETESRQSAKVGSRRRNKK